MNFKRKNVLVCTLSLLSLLIIVSVIISLCIGSFSISIKDVIQTLLGNGSKSQSIAIFQLRLPRIFIGILVGMALGMSGCILQGVTGNDLSDSGILGISSGSSLFVVIYIYLLNGNVYQGVNTLTIFTIPIVALLGAVFGAVLIYLLAYGKNINGNRLLLIGIGVNIGFTSLMKIFQLRFTTKDFNRVVAWTTGSIWGTNWSYVLAILPFILVFSILAIYQSRYLDILNLGDDLAQGLGVQVKKKKKYLIFISVVLAGVSTSVSGNIAFLGLFSPHISRKLVGPKHKGLLATSALVGGSILVIADTIGRTIISPLELPVGIVISIIGVPYFIYLMMSK